jgi:hypothetical protein
MVIVVELQLYFLSFLIYSKKDRMHDLTKYVHFEENNLTTVYMN